MVPLKVLICFTLGVSFVCCDTHLPNLDNVGNILQSIKDAGMMDKFEKQFGQMLFEEKLKQKDKAKEDPIVVNENESSSMDVFEFCKAYAQEKNIKLNEKAIFYLSELPVSDNDHLHVARITGILDVMGSIAELDQKDLDQKVIDITRRVKTLSVIRINLDKLYQEAAKESTKRNNHSRPSMPQMETKPKPKPKKKIETNLPHEVNHFIDMIRNDPDQLINYVTSTILDYELLSEKTVNMVDMYAKMFTQTEYFDYLMDTAAGYLEDFSKSDIGKKLVTLVPGLLEAEDLGHVIEIIDNHFDINLNSLVWLIEKYELGSQISDFFAHFLSAGIKISHETVNDGMKMTLVNTFLLAQDLPSINSRKLIPSVSKLVTKFVSIFSSKPLDVKRHEKFANDFIHLFEVEHMSWDEYHRMSDESQVVFWTNFLNENVADSFTLLWKAYHHVTKKAEGPKCATNMLCQLNSRMKSTVSKLKMLIFKRMSLIAAWALSYDEKLNYIELQKAIVKGSKKEQCDLIYNNEDLKSCKIFPWQTRKVGHVEL